MEKIKMNHNCLERMRRRKVDGKLRGNIRIGCDTDIGFTQCCATSLYLIVGFFQLYFFAFLYSDNGFTQCCATSLLL
jgi:hypothetical protein